MTTPRCTELVGYGHTESRCGKLATHKLDGVDDFEGHTWYFCAKHARGRIKTRTNWEAQGHDYGDAGIQRLEGGES
jgi:hypothetical protein